MTDNEASIESPRNSIESQPTNNSENGSPKPSEKKRSPKSVRIAEEEAPVEAPTETPTETQTQPAHEDDATKKRPLSDTGQEEAIKESEEEEPKKKAKQPNKLAAHTRSPSMTALGFLKKEYFKMGPLVYVEDAAVFGQSKKTVFFRLTATQVEGFPSAMDLSTPLKGMQKNLDTILKIVLFEKGETTLGEFAFALDFDDKTRWTLMASNKLDMAMWVIAFDGLLSNLKSNSFTSFVTPLTEKHKLLQLVYFDNYKGGVVKSSYEEEWIYEPNGLLTCQLLTDENKIPYTHQDFIQYKWDGEYFSPTSKSLSYGVGQWSGVFIVWYLKEWMIFKTGQREKMLKYFFDPKEREYRPESSLYTQWKWTRHFLASKGGEGEWAVEGEVPEPVIMFLQMIRYSRLGYRRVTENEEIVGIPDNSESRVFEFQPPASVTTPTETSWLSQNKNVVILSSLIGSLAIGVGGYFLYKKMR